MDETAWGEAPREMSAGDHYQQAVDDLNVRPANNTEYLLRGIGHALLGILRVEIGRVNR